MVEIGLDELGPFLRYLAGDLGISVTGEIGEDELGTWFSGPTDFEEINAAGASGCGTGARKFVADQRVNDAGFSNIRTPQKCDLRNRGNGEVGDVGCRCQKSR